MNSCCGGGGEAGAEDMDMAAEICLLLLCYSKMEIVVDRLLGGTQAHKNGAIANAPTDTMIA